MTRALRRLRGAGAVACVAFSLRLYTALASFETYDERNWTRRSSVFWDALSSADPGAASSAPRGQVATMPGVTTMWIGTFARGIWSVGGSLGLWSRRDVAALGGGTEFATTRSGLNVAQVCLAVVASVLIGVVVVLLDRWLGRTAALVAGVLLATEPFLIAHGAVLHTDELLALFGLASLVTAALVLGIPHPGPWTGRTWAAALSGCFLAGAGLTKLSALLLLPSLAVLVGWALLDRERRAWVPRLVVVAVAACAVTMLVLYPALWADPGGEILALRRSAALGDAGHVQFFRGATMKTPGPLFYLVTVPLRMTPWLLVGAAASAVALVCWRSTRSVAVALLVMAVPNFVGLSFLSKQLDRYGLLTMVLAAVAVGAAVSTALQRLTGEAPADEAAAGDASAGEAAEDDAAVEDREPQGREPQGREPQDREPQGRELQGRGLRRRRTQARVGLALAAGAVVVHAALVSPWGLAYYDPVLGGSKQAEKTVLVGWGEGFESAGPLVAELEHGHCDGLVVAGYQDGALRTCGRRAEPGESPDYWVVYVSGRQRYPPMIAAKVVGREVVARRVIRGIVYVEIYGPKPDEPEIRPGG